MQQFGVLRGMCLIGKLSWINGEAGNISWLVLPIFSIFPTQYFQLLDSSTQASQGFDRLREKVCKMSEHRKQILDGLSTRSNQMQQIVINFRSYSFIIIRLYYINKYNIVQKLPLNVCYRCNWHILCRISKIYYLTNEECNSKHISVLLQQILVGSFHIISYQNSQPCYIFFKYWVCAYLLCWYSVMPAARKTMRVMHGSK